jgi:hypothetical protein
VIELEDSAGAVVAYTVGTPNVAFAESVVSLEIDWDCAFHWSQAEESEEAGSRVDLALLISRSVVEVHLLWEHGVHCKNR